MVDLETRYRVLKAAQYDEQLQKDLVAFCKHDIIFWYETFVYTYDPRRYPYHFPFNPYPFQCQTIREILKRRQNSESMLLRKSRDQGATYMALDTDLFLWMFYPGSDFLYGSITEDDVDRPGEMKTLFPKLRYTLDFMPEWMCPRIVGNKRYDGHMRLVNPINGNSITGEPTTSDFGRSGRFKGATLDEFSKQRQGKAALEAVQQSTNSIILIWTPWGKAHEGYKIQKRESIVWVEAQREYTEEEQEYKKQREEIYREFRPKLQHSAKA